MASISDFRRSFIDRCACAAAGGSATDSFKFRTLATRKRKWARGVGADVGVLLAVMAALVACCHGYPEQRFAMEPQDQSEILGAKVTLPCRVENKIGTLQWTKDDFGLGTHRNLSGYERYTMIGSDEEGDYSLEIRNLTLDDDGRYQCQVSSGLNGEPGIRSQYAQLTVLVAPEAPRIVQGSFLDAVEGQNETLECVSAGGKPAAVITWVHGNHEVITENVQKKLEELDNGTVTSKSVLRLMVRKEHHNTTITCQALNTADRAPRMATIHIEVKYAPKIELFMKSETIKDRIREGSEARIGCKVDANPKPQMYRWYLNDVPVVGDFADELIIYNVTRKHNNAKVRCEVTNSAGTSEETMVLDVTYPPTFRSRPTNKEVDMDSTAELFCDVEGHPTPEIRWLFHEPGRIGVKGKKPELKFSVNKENAGRYTCKATVEGYPEIQADVAVFLKGEPKIMSNKTQFGTEGESVSIDCVAFSIPKHYDIRWYFEGREISVIQNPEYATLEQILPDGVVKSTLVIQTSRSHHFGTYNCSVTNDYGNSNVAIILKPTNTLPVLTIMTGVVVGIVIFSLFIALVVVCHRRSRQTNKENVKEKPDVTVTNSDMYKDSDRSSNISDLKPHLPDGNYDLDYTSSEASQKISNKLPLAGPVPLRLRHDDLLPFRYSNDYSDPAYSDPYFKNSGYIYDYQPGYPAPPTLRVQSPNHLDPNSGNRSLQGSLTRSIDTTSTLPLSNGSQNNSLKRTNKSIDETDAINSLGLPVDGDSPPVPIYAQPNSKLGHGGVDVRYAATYGNPYLRNSSLGFNNQVHTSKPASTPAPPPYSALRSSVVLPSGNGNQASQATHV